LNNNKTIKNKNNIQEILLEIKTLRVFYVSCSTEQSSQGKVFCSW